MEKAFIEQVRGEPFLPAAKRMVEEKLKLMHKLPPKARSGMDLALLELIHGIYKTHGPNELSAAYEGLLFLNHEISALRVLAERLRDVCRWREMVCEYRNSEASRALYQYLCHSAGWLLSVRNPHLSTCGLEVPILLRLLARLAEDSDDEGALEFVRSAKLAVYQRLEDALTARAAEAGMAVELVPSPALAS